MTTLADMTAEELDQCSGLWADTVVGFTGIIERISRKKVDLIIPKYKHKQSFPLSHVTLCDDIPRAWHPDGTPPSKEYDPHSKPTAEKSDDTRVSALRGSTHRWIGTREE